MMKRQRDAARDDLTQRKRQHLQAESFTENEDHTADGVAPAEDIVSETNHNLKSQNLCGKCSTVNFEAVFQTHHSKVNNQGVVILDMGFTLTPESDTGCQLCAMVAIILCDNILSAETIKKEPIRCHLRLFNCLTALGLARTPRRLALSPSLVLAAIPGDPDEELSILTRDASLAAGLILPTQELKGKRQKFSYIGQPIARDTINYSFVSGLIEECCHRHPQCSTLNPAATELNLLHTRARANLLVIDCQTRTMTELPPSKTYVALSYVWGPDFGDKLLEVAQEGTQITYPQPQTIEDAIEVVRYMELRYLWIDRYSINQHDVVAKEQAILSMAEIFEGAILTIVALGFDVEAGLPGVSPTLRDGQPSVMVGDLRLVSSGPALEDVLRKSIWSTRGWTLQEALLSKRMLFFANQQVYWKCASITTKESVEQPTVESMGQRSITPAFDPDMFSEAKQYRKRFGEMRLPLFIRQIIEYTRRDLSYDSDALNAFRALLGRAKEQTFYGIPIFLTQEDQNEPFVSSDTGFILGLLWSRSAHQWYRPWQEFGKGRKPKPESRRGFPSWSWTSTRHCIQFDPLSFDRELSKKHEQLYACTYPHSPYNRAYASVEVLGHGSIVQAINDVVEADADVRSMGKSIEAVLPSELQFKTLVVPWTIVSQELSYGFTTFRVALQLPAEIGLLADQSWFKQGLLFLDDIADISSVQNSPDATGTAMLLLNYRRYNFNWDDVVWWMAISPKGSEWRRRGLILSFHEANEPVYRAKDARTLAGRDHRRPVLPGRKDGLSYSTHAPDRSTLEPYYQIIHLV